ncbi:MAG: DUF1385 domain-containing protein [Clostridia bacterium]|nr:DUF1385 domain-containing protein [Clostridia bacterium]
MSNKNCNENKNCRLGQAGGQAVLEGVMMRAGERVALSVRTVDGDIKSDVEIIKSPDKNPKILKLPLIRGVVNFISSMKLSMKTLNKSIEMMGLEEEEPTKFEKWLDKHFGKSITAVAAGLGTVLGVALAVLLFMYIPVIASQWLFGEAELVGGMRLAKSAFSGVFKIFIFLSYITLVGFIPDIKRTFQYHGAEHKTIFCHEKNLPLTVENVKAQSRFHPRCGTSFLFIMMIIGIAVTFLFVNIPSTLIQTLLKLLTLPLVVGLGYEFIRYAGRHENALVRILAAPGLWVQRLTTKEPDEKQIEVAIQSLKAALPDDYPEILEVLEAQSDEKQNSEAGGSDTEQK